MSINTNPPPPGDPKDKPVSSVIFSCASDIPLEKHKPFSGTIMDLILGDKSLDDPTKHMCDRVLFSILPYGVWHTTDGNVVLFNRSYTPIYSKFPGDDVVVEDGHWINNIKTTNMFYDVESSMYNDDSDGSVNLTVFNRCRLVLLAFLHDKDLSMYYV